MCWTLNYITGNATLGAVYDLACADGPVTGQWVTVSKRGGRRLLPLARHGVCVCVCVCVCVHACMRACMRACMHACVRVCLPLHIKTWSVQCTAQGRMMGLNSMRGCAMCAGQPC
jgi:hypothetical protein